MTIAKDEFRKIAVSILKSGVDEQTYSELRESLEKLGMKDVIQAVDATDGEYYLSSDFE